MVHIQFVFNLFLYTSKFGTNFCPEGGLCHGKLIELIVLFKLKAFRLVCSDILFVSLSYIIHIYSSFHINA